MRSAAARPATSGGGSKAGGDELATGDCSWALRWGFHTACDHGARAGPESGEGNHRHVNNEEEYEQVGDEEVESARGLAATEKIDGCGKGGIESRGEREAGPDNEGKEDEDNHDVGGALDDVVGVAFRGIGRGAAKISREDAADGAPVAIFGRGKKVASEVAVEEACCSVYEAGEDENPGCFKVKIAGPAVLIGHDVVVAGGNGIARCGDRDLEERCGAGVAGFSPVKTRVGDDDFPAGDEQGEERNDGEPVRYADERGVPLGGLQLGRGSDGHAGRIAQRWCG